MAHLQINDNAIPNLNDVTPQLAHLKNLQTVYLEGNPCQKSDMANYRRKLIIALPQVSQIDATCVKSFGLDNHPTDSIVLPHRFVKL